MPAACPEVNLGTFIEWQMPTIASRRDLLAEIDAEHARLSALIDRVPPSLWRSSRVNAAGWSLKDVLAHVADWAERCDGWCALGDTLTSMTPPAAGFKWSETRELNHAIYLNRRRHALTRVLRDFGAAHAALRARAATMEEDDLLAVNRFAWCGRTWSIAQHIRANTAAHSRWACKHFKAALKAAGADKRAETITQVSTCARGARRTKRQSTKKTV